MSEAIERLKKTEDIVIATKAVGDYEGYAVLLFKSAKDFFEKVQKIKLMPEIEKIEFCFSTPVEMRVPPPSTLLPKPLYAMYQMFHDGI